jgi:hypothetical protein
MCLWPFVCSTANSFSWFIYMQHRRINWIFMIILDFSLSAFFHFIPFSVPREKRVRLRVFTAVFCIVRMLHRGRFFLSIVNCGKL